MIQGKSDHILILFIFHHIWHKLNTLKISESNKSNVISRNCILFKTRIAKTNIFNWSSSLFTSKAVFVLFVFLLEGPGDHQTNRGKSTPIKNGHGATPLLYFFLHLGFGTYIHPLNSLSHWVQDSNHQPCGIWLH